MGRPTTALTEWDHRCLGAICVHLRREEGWTMVETQLDCPGAAFGGHCDVCLAEKNTGGLCGWVGPANIRQRVGGDPARWHTSGADIPMGLPRVRGGIVLQSLGVWERAPHSRHQWTGAPLGVSRAATRIGLSALELVGLNAGSTRAGPGGAHSA